MTVNEQVRPVSLTVRFQFLSNSESNGLFDRGTDLENSAANPYVASPCWSVMKQADPEIVVFNEKKTC